MDDNATQSRTTSGPVYPSGQPLAYNFVTAQWYKLDPSNGRVEQTSSSFFNWDPQPEGMSALDLKSDDECVPIIKDNRECYPAYLMGARHYHTHIIGGAKEEGEADSTPLAFMFAYNIPTDGSSTTIGRNAPEGAVGEPVVLVDGTVPQLSLYFQFKGGLFAQFWADYDELLRHGNRTVEVPLRMKGADLSAIDMLKVYALHGVRCLVDKAGYTLPGAPLTGADFTLRPIVPQGSYDRAHELNIPDFYMGARYYLLWTKSTDTLGKGLNSKEMRKAAADRYIADNDYEPHPVDDQRPDAGEAFIDYRSARLRGGAALTSYEDDDTIPAPTRRGQALERQYRCELYYDIHELTLDPYGRVTRFPTPIGSVAVETTYTVTLIAKGRYG